MAVTAIAFTVGLTGCSASLVAGGALRPEPFQGIVTKTSLAAGIAAPEVLDTEVVNQEQVPALLREIIRRDYTVGELRDVEAGLAAVGFWPPDHGLLDDTAQLFGEEVAGFYVPETKKLYVVADPRMPFSIRMVSWLLQRDLAHEVVLAHEIVHALQHRQYSSVFEALRWQDQDDVLRGLQVAIEGDATRVGFLALLPPDYLPDALTFREEVEADAHGRAHGALAKIPGLLRWTYAFPYAHGYGLSLVEQQSLLTSPPISTEQVLHADRRTADFLSIDLRRLQGALPSQCVALHENTAGELAIAVLWRDLLGFDPAMAAAVADGWDGDRFVAARCGDRLEFVWWTSWDSEAKAKEFARAYEELAPKVKERGGHTAAPSVRLEGTGVFIATEALSHLRDQLPELSDSARVSNLEELVEYRNSIVDSAH